ncbi:fumarylacetoacetase [Burkholderia pseudomallei]|nr:fumarylacetoacetase [Burkholderia pseudomallei]
MSAIPDTLRASLDPSRKSWLDTANAAACDFPIQNLPFGIFSDARATRRAARASRLAIRSSISPRSRARGC